MKNKGLTYLGVFLGLVFLAIGYIYANHTAGTLPHFFPGYAAGSTTIHGKHSLAADILGLACIVFAWFQSGPKKTS